MKLDKNNTHPIFVPIMGTLNKLIVQVGVVYKRYGIVGEIPRTKIEEQLYYAGNKGDPMLLLLALFNIRHLLFNMTDDYPELDEKQLFSTVFGNVIANELRKFLSDINVSYQADYLS